MIMPIQGLDDLVASTPSPEPTGTRFEAQVDEIRIVGNTVTANAAQKGCLGHDFEDRSQRTGTPAPGFL